MKLSFDMRGVIFWTLYFLAAEIPAAAYYGRWPYPTLSRTIWLAIHSWHPISIFVAVFTFVLLGHLDLHWSVRWLIATAVAAASVVIVHYATIAIR